MTWRYLKVPRFMRTFSRNLLDWLPAVTGILYVLFSLSRIIALYKGAFFFLLMWYVCSLCVCAGWVVIGV